MEWTLHVGSGKGESDDSLRGFVDKNLVDKLSICQFWRYRQKLTFGQNCQFWRDRLRQARLAGSVRPWIRLSTIFHLAVPRFRPVSRFVAILSLATGPYGTRVPDQIPTNLTLPSRRNVPAHRDEDHRYRKGQIRHFWRTVVDEPVCQNWQFDPCGTRVPDQVGNAPADLTRTAGDPGRGTARVKLHFFKFDFDPAADAAGAQIFPFSLRIATWDEGFSPISENYRRTDPTSRTGKFGGWSNFPVQESLP